VLERVFASQIKIVLLAETALQISVIGPVPRQVIVPKGMLAT